MSAQFFAKVRIDSGTFDALTTGLTAELEFLVETKRHVTRVPVEAVRWIDDHPFAAALSGAAEGDDWQWRPIALGVTSTDFAEVVRGLEPGDRVVAHCESLPVDDIEIPEPGKTLDLALRGRPANR